MKKNLLAIPLAVSMQANWNPNEFEKPSKPNSDFSALQNCDEDYNKKIDKVMDNSEKDKIVIELKKELAECKSAIKTIDNEQESEEEKFRELYFEILGISENEYKKLVKNKKLRELFENSNILKRYIYEEDNYYDLYFYWEVFWEDSIKINIRPTRFEDSVNDYEKDTEYSLELEILDIKFFEPAFVSFLEENKNLEQKLFDEKLKDFFEKVKFLEEYKKRENDFFKKTIKYVPEVFEEKVRRSHIEFEYLLLKTLKENYGNRKDYIKNKLENNIYIKALKFNEITFKVLGDIIKEYPKEIENIEERKKYVRIKNWKVEISAIWNFKERINSYFTIPIYFIDWGEYKLTNTDKKEIDFISDLSLFKNWIEETLKEKK